MVEVGAARSRTSGRRAVGTLLIIVMCILSALFIMAMMQYFASTLTRGKRFLYHIAVTDYACESALDETLVRFKAHMNPQGDEPPADPIPFAELHRSLTRTGRVRDFEYDPVATKTRYLDLYGDKLSIDKVKISFESHKIEMPELPTGNTTATAAGGASAAAPATPADPPTDIETRGVITFTATVGFETTKKAMSRAYEYRQIVVQPPGRLNSCAFAATDFTYVRNRLNRMHEDWTQLKEVVQNLVQRICFAYTLLRYICEPAPIFGDAAASFQVGIEYAKKVIQQHTRLVSDLGQAEADRKLNTDLGVYRDGANGQHLPNPNFNLNYLKAMSSATTQNLQAVMTSLNQDFGMSATGDDPLLSMDDPYPLSPAGTTTKEYVNSYNRDAYQIRFWGKGRTMGELKDANGVMKEPELTFNFTTMPGATAVQPQAIRRDDPLPEFVVGVADGAGEVKVDSADLAIGMKIPPIVPTVPTDAPPAPVGEVESAAVSVALTKDTLDQYISDCRLKKIAKGELKDEFDPSVEKDAASGNKMPSLSLSHPKTDYDWAFRLPQKDYETNFANRKEAYDAWKAKILPLLRAYVDGVKRLNEDKITKRVQAIQNSPKKLAAEIGDSTVALERAAFRFRSVQDFQRAMKELRAAQGITQENELPMDGMYLISKRNESASTGSTPTTSNATSGSDSSASSQMVRIAETRYRGEGILAADGIDLPSGIQNAEPAKKGQLIIWGTEPGVPCQLNGEIQASVISRGPLSIPESADIKGMLAVADVPCQKAQPITSANSPQPGSSNRPSNDCLSEGKSDDRWANYYWTALPRFKITYTKQSTNETKWLFSHINMSPYRIAAGGKRLGN